MGKKETSLSWDAFQALGNPENAPEMPADEGDSPLIDTQSAIRIHLQRNKGGKVATVIKGFTDDDDFDALKDLAKQLKTACGVGGSFKNNEIIIQGNKRDQVVDILKSEGFKNVKKAGG